MRRVWLAAALWLGFAFVAWNVSFDRQVATAALDHTREQVLRHQHGEAPVSLHAGFSPLVRHAALRASLWSSPILIAGVLATYLAYRRKL